MNRTPLIIIGVGGFLILITILVLSGILPGTRTSKPQPVTIEMWGVKDSDEDWRGVLRAFHEVKPHIAVNYQEFSEENYEPELINKLAEGKGPDIFMLKNSWVQKHGSKIIPLPIKTLKADPQAISRAFIDIFRQDLVSKEGAIFGLPLYVDAPALFYNKDIFNSAGIAELPQTWENVLEISKRLTQKAPGGSIIRSGIALGTFQNVEYAFEILNSIMLQNGATILDLQEKKVVLGEEAERAIEFYTSFANPKSANFSWNNRFKPSLDALAEGNTAMAFGIADDIERLSKKNPHLNFGVLPFPQLKDSNTKAVYGTYFFPAVSKFSKNPLAGWEFLLVAASRDGAGAYISSTDRVPARRDILGQGTPVEKLDPFYRQILSAKSWPIPDDQSVRRLFGEVTESAASGATDSHAALERLRGQLQLMIQ